MEKELVKGASETLIILLIFPDQKNTNSKDPGQLQFGVQVNLSKNKEKKT